MLLEVLSKTWPWYVAGPAIGLFVPVLLWAGDKRLGVSGNLRHLCAALLPKRGRFLRYDWRREGMWNLTFLAGTALGGWIGVTMLGTETIAISAETREALAGLDWFDGPKDEPIPRNELVGRAGCGDGGQGRAFA